ALRWAQLQASDAVLVPSESAARWLAEEGRPEAVHVVPWPGGAADAPRPERIRAGDRLLLISPTPAIRAMVEFALSRLETPAELVVLSTEDLSEGLDVELGRALALGDFGGTPAGILVRAIEMGVPVLSSLTSVAGAPHLPTTPTAPSVEGLVAALAALRERTEAPGETAPDPVSGWSEVLDRVLLAPAAGRAEARAAIQLLSTC